jgi:multicomponent Na+:H+ antiporter subunit G
VTPGHAAELVFLAAGTACLCLSCVGVAFADGSLPRIHFLGPAAVLGVPMIAIAIVIAHGFDAAGTMACLVALTLLLVNPIQAHVLGRALRIRQFGHWIVLPDEKPAAAAARRRG